MLKRLFLILITGFLFQQSFAQDALLLKTPSNGQVISGGEYFNITWERSNVENIKIEYSLDAGTTWSVIIDSYAAQAGKYPWLVPAKPTTRGKVRISDIDNSSTSSVNPGSFTISEPQLTFDMDTTAAIVKGNALRIGWNSLSVEKVNLYYSIDEGSNYIVIRKGFPALASSLTWIVPQINSSKISLKIESSDSTGINSFWKNAPLGSNIIPIKNKYQGGSFDGHSSTSNTIPKLNLIFPAGNETLASSSVQTIRWTSSNIEYLKVEFSSDSGLTWETLNTSYPAYAKKLDWRVPTNTTLKGIIRLTSVEDEKLKVINATPFKIPLKSIALSETFEHLYYPQQPIQISWVNNGVDFISLQYRTPATGSWKTITKSVSALLLNYIWIPPVNLVTDSLRFKISSVDQSVQDSSKNLLSIRAVSNSSSKYKGGSYDGFSQTSNLKPAIELISPSANSKLNGFASTNITWKSRNIESVSIHFSTDSGKAWKEVIKSFSGNAFKYPWTVPDDPTLNGFLRISSSEDSTIKSISGKFQISDGFVKLSSDTVFSGGINTVLPISWIQSGVSKVNILTRADTAGSNWTKVVSNYNASAGTYLWIQKQTLSGQHSLKIENVSGLAISDSIKINFNSTSKIPTVAKYRGGSYDGHSSRSNVSKILVTKPQAGEVLISGTTYNITWSTVNVSDSVKIEYTSDNGQTWKIISVAVDSKTGSYQWTVPGSVIGTKSLNKRSGNFISAALNECKIRISETGSQEDVVGLSNNTFVISGSNDIQKANQTIAFESIPNKSYGAVPFKIRAIASSGLPVSFKVISGPVTITDSIINLNGSGNATIEASQAGDGKFFPATSVQQSFTITKAIQSIAFNILADRSFGDASFTLQASASSGLPITYFITSGPATLLDSVITLTGAGKVTVKASQPGNINYLAAEAIREFNINELPLTNFTVKATGESCKNSDNGKIEIKAVKNLKYTATINGNNFSQMLSFTGLLEITDLAAGNYSLCITVEGQKDYRQCYDLVITEPKDLVVYATVNSNELNLILSGSSSYNIVVNGNKYATTQQQYRVSLQKGRNNISVSTDALCQGVFNKEFTLTGEVLIYPNPFDNILKLHLEASSQKAKIVITDILGNIVYTGQNRDQNSFVEIDLSYLLSGAYVLKLFTEDSETVYKIIKR